MFVMKKKCIIFLMVFVGVMIGYEPNTQAQIQEVKVEVKGLSCPFCVKGVEKHLKKVEGVKNVSTSLKRGIVTLHYKPQSPFDVKSIEKAVIRGGFTPGAVQLSARGKVIQQDKSFVFTPTDTKSSFSLYSPSSAKGHKKGESVSEKTKTALEQATNTDQLLEITGVVHSHKDGLPGLSVKGVKKVSVKAKSHE